MKKSILLACSLLVPMTLADEVKMKDGTLYKGCTIEIEDVDTISILVPISGGIKDSVTLKRGDIEYIKKLTAEEILCNKLQKNYATPGNMSIAQLEAGVKEMDSLLKKHPKDKATDVISAIKTTLSTTLAEKKVVLEQKEKELAAEEAAVTDRTRYDHEAKKLARRFKARAKTSTYQALAVYDKLRADYPGTEALAEIEPTAKKMILSLNSQLANMIVKKEKSLQKERDLLSKEEAAIRANRKLTVEQRRELQAKWRTKMTALRERESDLTAQHRALRKKVREKGDYWYEPIAESLDSLRELKSYAAREADRVKVPLADDAPKPGAATKAMAEAWKLCDEKKFSEAMDQITVLRLVRVPREYFSGLEEAIRTGAKEQLIKEREERMAQKAKERAERANKQKEQAQKKQ